MHLALYAHRRVFQSGALVSFAGAAWRSCMSFLVTCMRAYGEWTTPTRKHRLLHARHQGQHWCWSDR